MMMKKFTQSVLLLVATLGLFTACGPTEIPSTPLEEAVKPVATFMNATPGVQLFSFFTSDAYKEEKVVVKGMACLTGSYGDKPAVGMCALEVDGVKIKPHFLVSQEDKEKLQTALKKAEQDSKGAVESLSVVLEGTLVKEGSQKSPFGGELDLRFADAKLLQIQE